MKGTHNDIIFSKNEGFGIFRWYVPSYFDDAWNEWSSSIAWWWYVYRHKETKQSTPPEQNSFWKIKKMIIIREKKRAAGFRFASKSVLTFHATLKQEGICVQNLRMLASTQYEHRHRPPLSCAWHRVVLVRGAMEVTTIDNKTTNA